MMRTMSARCHEQKAFTHIYRSMHGQVIQNYHIIAVCLTMEWFDLILPVFYRVAAPSVDNELTSRCYHGYMVITPRSSLVRHHYT